MKRLTALFLLLLVAETYGQGTSNVPPKRNWVSRMLHPLSSSTRLPEYNDPRLRGLTLRLELSPQPVKLSEVRLLDVKVTLTNLAKHPIELHFPNEQRIEIYLLNTTERVLTKWSDNHAFADKPGDGFDQSGRTHRIQRAIATRDLTPNTVFIADVFFPGYPDLRIRQKFLTAP